MMENGALTISSLPHIICSKHGDIGIFDGPGGDSVLRFTVSDETNYFCIRCLERLLLGSLGRCEVTND